MQVCVEARGEGRHRLWFSLAQAGRHEVAVTVGGRPVQRSPFTCTVSPGAPDLMTCRLVGPGIDAATVGEQACVQLEAYDSFRNRLDADSMPAVLRKWKVRGQRRRTLSAVLP